MTIEETKTLIEKYEEGQTTLREEQILRDYFEQEDIPAEFQPFAAQFHYFRKVVEADSESQFDAFAKIDFKGARISPFEGGKRQRRRGMAGANRTFRWTIRIAAGIALLVIGFAAGHFTHINPGPSNESINPKIQQMKAALMNIGYYKQPSAGKRLAAVNISQKLSRQNSKLDRKIADILTYTINADDNVNVRMAAAEALYKYRDEIAIKPALLHSLRHQNDPLMQITLINMLVKLKAKGAIPEMQQMLVASGTQKIVRTRLKVGIAQLEA
jgi:hypothetical protein